MQKRRNEAGGRQHHFRSFVLFEPLTELLKRKCEKVGAMSLESMLFETWVEDTPGAVFSMLTDECRFLAWVMARDELDRSISNSSESTSPSVAVGYRTKIRDHRVVVSLDIPSQNHCPYDSIVLDFSLYPVRSGTHVMMVLRADSPYEPKI